MDASSEWSGQSSVDRRATVLLRQEHQALLDLFRRQREPLAEPGSARAALQDAIIELLELIEQVERDVFFPALPAEYEPLVRAFLVDQRAVAQCLASLRRAADNAARSNAAGERLENLTRDHMAHEETLLFSALEREHPHLNEALYDRLVTARAHLARKHAAGVAG